MKQFKLTALGNRGLAMTIALPVMLVLLAFAAALFQLTSSGIHFTALASARQKSFYVADGGLQNAMTRLYADRTLASTNVSYTASQSGTIGDGSFTYAVVQDPMYPSDPTRKQVSSTGTVAGTRSTVVSQVKVYPFSAPGGGGDTNPTCDWALFANRGVSELVSGVLAATNLIQAGNASDTAVHSNNDIRITSLTGAGVHGSGRFESVDDTIVQALVGGVDATMNANLYRGGSFVTSGGLSDVHAPFTGTPILGIHFADGYRHHGQQQAVNSIPFPLPDWKALEQTPGMVIVDKDHVPFGSWDDDTDTDDDTGTWVVNVNQVFPGDNSAKYFVRGNVRVHGITLARSADALIAAVGSIEIDQLSLLQTSIDLQHLGIGLNSVQTLRLIGKGNVFVGRGMLQTAANALLDTDRAGLNLTAALAVTNQIGAYSETGDVWVKSSAITAFARTKLNLMADNNSTYAVTGSIASTPSTWGGSAYCQPVT